MPKEELYYGILPYEGNYEQSISLQEWSAQAISNYSSSTYNLKNELRNNNRSNSTFIILILGFGILAFVFAFYRRRFQLLLKSFFNWKLSKQIIRYEKVHLHPVNIGLLILFVTIAPFYFVISYYGRENAAYFDYYIIGLALLLTYLFFKLIIYRFSAWLLQLSDLVNQYLFQVNLYSKFLGVFYLTLLPFLLYSTISEDFFLAIGLIALLVFAVLQIGRGIIIGLSEAKRLLLIILYLCTLEILPWILILKSVKF